jgi:acyl carrier protein
MEIKTFINDFASIFMDLDASEIDASTEFHELDDWSSLIVIQLISLAMGKYDVELTVDEIRKAQTIQDLFNLINR